MKDFKLRAWKKEDAKSLAQSANNPNIAKNLRNAFPFPYTIEDAVWYINDCISKEGKNKLLMPLMLTDKLLAA